MPAANAAPTSPLPTPSSPSTGEQTDGYLFPRPCSACWSCFSWQTTSSAFHGASGSTPIDGTETLISSVAAKAGQWRTSNALYVPVSIDRAKQMTSLTLILVGDGEPLKDTPDQTKYWTGRIVYPDVPLGSFKQHHASNQRAPTTHPYRIELPTPD